MSYQTSVALILLPLPAMVWFVGQLVVDMLPKKQVELKQTALWASRLIAVFVQVALLNVAQNIAEDAGASSAIMGLLDWLVIAGFGVQWLGLGAFVFYSGYQVFMYIKRYLEEKGHALSLKQ